MARELLTLSADDLCSKWGFSDGDLLTEHGFRYTKEKPPATGPMQYQHWNHEVLILLVRRHLLPLMPGAEVEEIGTHHNPIRFTDWHEREFFADPVTVQVTEEQIEDAAQAVEKRWRDANEA